MIESIVVTVSLAVVALACALHVNGDPKTTSHCEKIGFAVSFGGCLGVIAERWMPELGSWLHGEPVLCVGLALVALSMDRDRMRAFLSRTIKTAAYQGQERRRT